MTAKNSKSSAKASKTTQAKTTHEVVQANHTNSERSDRTPKSAAADSAAHATIPSYLDAKSIAKFRKLLLEEKQRLINNSKNAIKSELALSPDDLPDETDLAVSEINQNLIFKLRDRERQLLVKIDEALARMDEGTFGTCEDCEEPIEPRRLEARPVSTLCIACKERQEHREKIYA